MVSLVMSRSPVAVAISASEPMPSVAIVPTSAVMSLPTRTRPSLAFPPVVSTVAQVTFRAALAVATMPMLLLPAVVNVAAHRGDVLGGQDKAVAIVLKRRDGIAGDVEVAGCGCDNASEPMPSVVTCRIGEMSVPTSRRRRSRRRWSGPCRR